MALQESDHLGLRAFLASEAEKGSSAAESEESSEQTRPSSPAGDETEHSGGASEYDGGPPYTQRDVRYGAEDGGLPCTQRDVQYGAEDAAQTDSTVIARRVRTPAVAAGSHRKRPGDDVDTFVQRVAQRMKLKQSTMQELLKFSKVIPVLVLTKGTHNFDLSSSLPLRERLRSWPPSSAAMKN